MVLASAISDVRGVREEGVMGEWEGEFPEVEEALLGDVMMGELAELIGAEIGQLQGLDAVGVAGIELT